MMSVNFIEPGEGDTVFFPQFKDKYPVQPLLFVSVTCD